MKISIVVLPRKFKNNKILITNYTHSESRKVDFNIMTTNFELISKILKSISNSTSTPSIEEYIIFTYCCLPLDQLRLFDSSALITVRLINSNGKITTYSNSTESALTNDDINKSISDFVSLESTLSDTNFFKNRKCPSHNSTFDEGIIEAVSTNTTLEYLNNTMNKLIRTNEHEVVYDNTHNVGTLYDYIQCIFKESNITNEEITKIDIITSHDYYSIINDTMEEYDINQTFTDERVIHNLMNKFNNYKLQKECLYNTTDIYLYNHTISEIDIHTAYCIVKLDISSDGTLIIPSIL